MSFLETIVVSNSLFFLFACVVFFPLERLVPARLSITSVPVDDWLHLWLNPIIMSLAALTAIASLGHAINACLPAALLQWIHARPLWQQLALAVLLAEIWGYWAHRLAHTLPFLWRFHAVHHSVEHMTWASALRQHPFDAIFIEAGGNLPAFSLGIDLRALATFVIVERVYTILLHANIDFSYGWFDHILASSRFHHWHHDSGPVARNRNFAGFLPLLDVLFGTYHSTAEPAAQFGPARLAPTSYWGQFWQPIHQAILKNGPPKPSPPPLPPASSSPCSEAFPQPGQSSTSPTR